MANASWPAGLPDYQITPIRVEDAPGVVWSRMDVGPPKARRRSTVRRQVVRFDLWLTGDEWATFQTFFCETLQDGALPFDWTHPATDAAQTYRFRRPPNWTLDIPARATGERRWKASIELETVPS